MYLSTNKQMGKNQQISASIKPEIDACRKKQQKQPRHDILCCSRHYCTICSGSVKYKNILFRNKLADYVTWGQDRGKAGKGHNPNWQMPFDRLRDRC